MESDSEDDDVYHSDGLEGGGLQDLIESGG